MIPLPSRRNDTGIGQVAAAVEQVAVNEVVDTRDLLSCKQEREREMLPGGEGARLFRGTGLIDVDGQDAELLGRPTRAE